MMPYKCRLCKYYISMFSPKYHGIVEGCSYQADKKHPGCYEKKTDVTTEIQSENN